MSQTSGELPFKLVAGVVPCAGGWLLVGARLKGATFAPDFPRVVEELYDIVHRRPAFAIVALNAPIGDPLAAIRGERPCDLEGAELIGQPMVAARWHGVVPLPLAVEGDTSEQSILARRFAEVTEAMAPYLQRTVCEGVPDLSFYQLNNEAPLTYDATTDEGYAERRELLAKFPGVSRILDSKEPGVTRLELLEASALLWSARRISARAGKRVPGTPQWDENGLRIEILR